MSIRIDGQLEIDCERGVIYFHNSYGSTNLRIQGLPRPIKAITDTKAGPDLLDIHVEKSVVSWEVR